MEITRNMGKKKREKKQRARKCFVCGDFRHIIYHCRNMREEGSVQMLSNKFEVLKSRIMKRGEGSGSKAVKDRKEILRKKRAKRRVEV